MDYSKGYGKRPLWQWIAIYLAIGGLIYFAVYYFYFAKKGGAPYETTIAITASGFQPGNITVKAGDTVVWKNQGAITGNVSSAPHPAHTDYSPLNLGDIAPGASVSLTLPTAGAYRFHNHLNPSQFGSVTVQ